MPPFLTISEHLSPWTRLMRSASGGEAGASGVADPSPSPGAGETPPDPVQGGTTDPAPAGEEKPASGSFLDEGTEGEAKAEGEAEDAEAPPLSLTDFTPPEGFTLPEAEGQEFLAILNDRTLAPKDLGQKLLDFHSKQIASAQDAIAEQWDTLQTQWKAEAGKALETLGVTPDAGKAQINKGLRAAGANDETFEALRLTGAANNPKIVALLYKLSAPFVEGKQVGGEPARQVMTRTERAAGFYTHPTSQPKE